MSKCTTIKREKQVAPSLKVMKVGDSEVFPKQRASVVRGTVGRLQVDLDRAWKTKLSGDYIIVTRIA